MKATARLLAATALLLICARATAASCTVSAQPVAFGSYDPLFLLPSDSTGQITVDCTSAISELVTYTLSLSTGGSGSYSPRRLSFGANTLSYNLYTDVARSTLWGDGTAGTSQVQNIVTVGVLGFSQNHTIYGRVPAQQNVVPGAYGDTIVVTLDY